MEAGRELDALVAEKVMGWTAVGIHHWNSVRGIPMPWYKDEKCGVPPGKKEAGEYASDYHHIPPYSTDIAAAWEVVEKMRGTAHANKIGGCAACVEIHSWDCTDVLDPEPEHFWAVIWGEEAIAVTAPHAICLAALKAVGVDV